MKIGISSTMDVSVLLPFIESTCDRQKIKDLACKSQTPAVDTLVLSLLQKGHFLRIFTMGNEDYIYKSSLFDIFIIKANTNYIVRNTWNVYDKASRIKRVIQQNYKDLDVIHAHWTYEHAYALKALSSEIPVVCTVRDWAPYIWKFVILKDKPMWTFKYMMARSVYACNKIQFVANSPYTFNLLKGIGINAPIIPNSIDDSFFEDVIHHPSEKLELLCISSSDDSRKNIISLLRAFQIIRSKHPTAVLKLVGGCFTPESSNCIKYASEGLLEGVELCGFVNHEGLKSYLDKATIFVTPSLEETFGNTLLESISRKVPTVGGINSGAVPHVLHHGEWGYLCDVSSPDEIAHIVDYIFTHKEEAAQKSEYAFHMIQKEYGAANVADRYIDLYTSCVTKKSN